MNPDFAELAVVAGALALGGLMKGITGVGLPLVSVPIMAGVLGVERAVVLMVLPSLVLNAVQAWGAREARAAVPEMPRLLWSGAVGVVLGSFLLMAVNDDLLAVLLAAWLLVYAGFRFLRPRFSLSAAFRRRYSPLIGWAGGAMQGATGVSAPLIVPYADSLGLRPGEYIYTVTTAFGTFAATHFVLLAAGGAYDLATLMPSLFAVVPAVACVPIGARIRRFMSPAGFDRLIRIILIVMAVRLLWGVYAAPGGA